MPSGTKPRPTSHERAVVVQRNEVGRARYGSGSVAVPRLILFAACRQILINSRDDTVTLVGLMERVRVNRMADGEAPSVADVPWEHLTVWQAETEDGYRKFEQRLEVVRPDRRVAAEIRQPFAMKAGVLRIMGTVAGFPSELTGEYVLRLSVRAVDEGDAWTRVSEYPVLVEHAPPEEGPGLPAPELTLPGSAPSRHRPAGRGRGGGARRPGSRKPG